MFINFIKEKLFDGDQRLYTSNFSQPKVLFYLILVKFHVKKCCLGYDIKLQHT